MDVLASSGSAERMDSQWQLAHHPHLAENMTLIYLNLEITVCFNSLDRGKHPAFHIRLK
jgi:hypothetical protein